MTVDTSHVPTPFPVGLRLGHLGQGMVVSLMRSASNDAVASAEALISRRDNFLATNAGNTNKEMSGILSRCVFEGAPPRSAFIKLR